jgi:hypothetical protein
MLASVIVNLLIAVLAVAAVAAHCKKAPLKVVLRFFTALSNLLCALACLAVAVCRLFGTAPAAVLIVKFVGTAAVSVTFLTVMCFLGPVVYDYKKMLSGPDLWLHLVCPVLAVVSLIAWDRPRAPFGLVLLGALPVLLYGAYYLAHVVLAPPEKRWEDFYGFNRGGKWYLSYIPMLLLALLVSFALWVGVRG